MSDRINEDAQRTQAFHNDYETALPEHYRLIEMIGRGGMAEVFLAEDKRLSRKVAIKFLNSEFRRDPERMRRFHQEARAASALNHPNIIIIHDIGENEGVQYLVSEFVSGETLNSRIHKGRLPLDETIAISIQIASALGAAHSAGIVHRDIKPDNVMIRPDGSVKVLDFGLAKSTGLNITTEVGPNGTPLNTPATSPGLILGTPQYMSPEQARGKQLDPRTDIFSLGIIIFEMLTGKSPFPGGSTVDIIAAIIGKEPYRIEEFLTDPPLTLVNIIQRALQKNRSDRYGSMDELLADLNTLKNQLVIEPYQGTDTERAETRVTYQNTLRSYVSERISFRPLIAMLLILGLAAAAGWWYFRESDVEGERLSSTLRTIPITSWSSGPRALVSEATFSPDARMIAYAATKTDLTEIWVKPTDGGDPIPVTKNGNYNQYPVWSPNNQHIAFFSTHGTNRGIWRAAFTGGEQSQILGGVGPTVRPMFWSADGKIYFQEERELFRVDERSGEREQLTDFGSKDLKPWFIDVSRDGSSIAYSIKDPDGWKLKTKRLDSDAVTEIATSNEQIDHISWNPNGRSVFFSATVEGNVQIFEAGLDGKGPVQLSNGNNDLYVQDVSIDGWKILYGSVSETSDLWMVNTQDQKEVIIANDTSAEYWPSISPDGKVAYQSVNLVERITKGSIGVMGQAGSAAPDVVSSEGFAPVWSPDGKWVAYFRRSAAGFSIFRAGPSGENSVRIAEGEIDIPDYTVTPYLKINGDHLSWSPDSGSLAYTTTTDGVANIWQAAGDGSWQRQLTANSDSSDRYCCPTWSADGKFVMFTSKRLNDAALRQTGYRLWLFELDNSNQRMLYESKQRFRYLGIDLRTHSALIVQESDPAGSRSPSDAVEVFSISLQTLAILKIGSLKNTYFHNIHLSPDGRTFAFVSRRDNVTTLSIVPVGGGTPKALATENDPKVLFSSLAWSPDGSSIVFGKQTRTNLISMLSK